MSEQFSDWLNSLDMANLRDLPPNDAMEMGWNECKRQILEILETNRRTYEAHMRQQDWDYYPVFVKEEIEEL